MNAAMKPMGPRVAQPSFVSMFTKFLTGDAKIGLVPCDIEKGGEIRYGFPGEEQVPLQRLLLIDGSPRQERVRGIDIPSLHDERAKEKEKSSFFFDVYALQKSIEVPFGPLMIGMSSASDRAFSDEIQEAAFRRRLQVFGGMSAREFLAAHSGKGAEEREAIIRPVAEDVHAIVERIEEDKNIQEPVDDYLINSAVLFAALGDKTSHERAADNFFKVAKSLFGQKEFVAAAVLYELATDIIEPHAKDDTKIEDKMNKANSNAAVAWNVSLETDPNAETYNFRLYRGMRRAMKLPISAFPMDWFLQKAEHLDISKTRFAASAESAMRRAWYAAQRRPMIGQHWTFVRDKINRAVAAWMMGKGEDDKQAVEASIMDQAVWFANLAEKLEVGETLS